MEYLNSWLFMVNDLPMIDILVAILSNPIACVFEMVAGVSIWVYNFKMYKNVLLSHDVRKANNLLIGIGLFGYGLINIVIYLRH